VGRKGFHDLLTMTRGGEVAPERLVGALGAAVGRPLETLRPIAFEGGVARLFEFFDGWIWMEFLVR
jgi:hypothetical protein